MGTPSRPGSGDYSHSRHPSIGSAGDMRTPSRPASGNYSHSHSHSRHTSVGSAGNMTTPSPSRPVSGNYNRRTSTGSAVSVGHAESIDRSMSRISISSQPPPTSFAKRPGFGTLGTSVKAKVNFYPIDISKLPKIFDYEVKIRSKDKGDADVRGRTRGRVIQLLLEQTPLISAGSDYSRRIVSTKKIRSPQGHDYSCAIDYYEPEESGPRTGSRSLQFTVTIKETGQLDMENLTKYLTDTNLRLPDSEKYISALNILLSRTYSQDDSMVTSGRRTKFFNVRNGAKRHDLNFGLEVYQGYFRAVTPTISGLVLNVNTAAAVMIKPGLLHEIINTMVAPYSSLLPVKRLAILNRELRFLRVTHRFFGYAACKNFFEIAAPRDANGQLEVPIAMNIKFLRDKHPKTGQHENREVTVAQHFKDAYPRTRRVNERAWVVNLGSKERPNYVPSDLLEVIPGNLYHGLVPHSTQGAIMITSTCRPPGINRALIQNPGLKYLGVGVDSGPQDRFNIVISDKMMSTTARLLPAPSIIFGPRTLDASTKKASSGRWNLSGVKFKKACSQVKVSWLEFKSRGSPSAVNLQNFRRSIETGVRNYCGFNAELITFPKFNHSRELTEPLAPGTIQNVWREMKTRGKVELVFVILPDKSAENYSLIKLSADVLEGIHTICTVVKKDISNKSNAVSCSVKDSVGEIANLILKFNMKLGGINLGVNVNPMNILTDLLTKTIMFVGADVGHPAPGSMKGAPSVAGVVASMDSTFFQYAGIVRLQNHHDENKKSIEFILHLKDMLIEHLQSFQRRNAQRLPEVIVLYRDGVANTMFTECIDKELSQIKQACRTVYINNPQPRIVYVVAQKRHHTRFYQIDGDKSGAFDGKGNPKPGFIVDENICDSRLWDWYLTSHSCLQGTSRAAHYTVLHNETDLSADQIQLMTYAQCWLLGRTNSSISIHPAARHADLLCDRARVYLRPVYVPQDPNDVYVASEHWTGTIHANMKDKMFWV